MLSIIICSVDANLLKQVSDNIAETVGVPYEFLVADNKSANEGICKVYNRLAAQAQYPYLCFIHEDVVLHTNGWGKVLCKLLADNTIGLVGISGTVYKSKYAGTWSSCQSIFYRTNSIQHFKKHLKPIINNINPENAPFAEVAVIDGVFIATRKDVFSCNKFDEKLLSGFHGYDIDYSIQVRQQFKVIVSYEILLEHLSEGKLSDQWISSSLLVHKKWNQQLPIAAMFIESETMHFNDYLALKTLLAVALNNSGNKRLVLENYVKLIC